MKEQLLKELAFCHKMLSYIQSKTDIKEILDACEVAKMHINDVTKVTRLKNECYKCAYYRNSDGNHGYCYKPEKSARRFLYWKSGTTWEILRPQVWGYNCTCDDWKLGKLKSKKENNHVER